MANQDLVPIELMAPPVLPRTDFGATAAAALRERQATLGAALDRLTARSVVLGEIATRLVQTLRSGRKVLAAGNGGSAAEAQHFVAELVGRFKRERDPYAAMALTTDTAILTAVANDYGYDQVFARQVAALGEPGDLLILFSTSGESQNVVTAAATARRRCMTVVAVTANRPSRLERLADLTLRVPVADTASAQELHMVVTHVLCDLIEAELAAWRGGGDR